MTTIDLTVGEQDFGVQFNMVNETTGSGFDLTLFPAPLLFIKTTDYVTSIVPGGIVILPFGNPTDGILLWNVQSAHIPTLSGQYFGQIILTDPISGEIRKSRQFDIRVLRKLD